MTLVFNKGRGLFAINLAKKSKAGYIILAEGNVDVVSMHQAGFDSAVASLWPSLTPESGPAHRPQHDQWSCLRQRRRGPEGRPAPSAFWKSWTSRCASCA
jgi:hypothetical protein